MTTFVGVLVAAYVVVLALAYAFQRKLIYPIRTGGEPQCRDPGTYLRFAGPSGRQVHTVYYPGRPGEPTITVFHGNAYTLPDVVPLLEALAREGVGAYGVEYPGYGPAGEYSPSETALYEDAEAALVHLERELGVSRSRTVLMGRSLGTGVAVEMARRGRGARLILIAPFTSMPAVAARRVPFLLPNWILKDRFDNLAKAPQLTIPTLILHGNRDELVPFDMGQRLAKALPQARLIEVDGGRHNDLRAHEPEVDPTEVVRFIRTHDR